MKQIAERVLPDVVAEGALNNTNTTGPYRSMARFRRILALLLFQNLAATKTVTLELVQAQDNAGTGVKSLNANTAANNAIKTLTANADAHAVSIALATVANTDVVTINGVAFIKAAATTIASREFADAAGLVACVNSADYGVPNASASAVSTTVTVVGTDGETDLTVTKTENAGTITLATEHGLVAVEIESADLDASNGFGHVAPKITTTGNITFQVVFLEGDHRYPYDRSGAYQLAVVGDPS